MPARGRLTGVSEGMTRGGRFTVQLALAANLGVGLAKLVAGLLTGSGALLSEAAHSAGDTTTEVLLLVALRRSGRPADRRHPFGYGKERFFWSLLAAVAIFVSGAGFSVFQGVHTLLTGGEFHGREWVDYAVLGVALVLESVSLRNAAGQIRQQTRRRRRSVARVVLEPEDPTVNSVVLEDTTAVLGIVIAAAGVALHQITGSAVPDGIASLIIGTLLLGVAFLLARSCADLLIGKQAAPELLREIEAFLERQREIDDVVDLLTMVVGTGRVLVCARADFVDTVSAGELESACVRIETQLREQYPEVTEVFIQPASRADRGMRARVEGRYGRALADRV
jgi:cation diffusion facilitator family transporter